MPLIDARLRVTHDLSLAFYDVLLELQAAPDGQLTMSDLGERVVLSRSRVSRVVDEMILTDLVERVTNPRDARSAYAVITPAGRDAFRRSAPIYLELITRHIASVLTTDELAILSRLLERVASGPGTLQ